VPCFDFALTSAAFGYQQPFAGQDLHLSCSKLTSFRQEDKGHILVFTRGVDILAGGSNLSAEKAVVWVEPVLHELRGRSAINYKVRVYLETNPKIAAGHGGDSLGLVSTAVKAGESIVVQFAISGQIFVTANQKTEEDVSDSEFYKRAAKAAKPVRAEFVVQPEARVPEKLELADVEQKKPFLQFLQPIKFKGGRKGFIRPAMEPEMVKKRTGKKAKPELSGSSRFEYSINISPAGDEPLDFESLPGPEELDTAILRQRFYIWQRRPNGTLLELQADSAVIFYAGKTIEASGEEDETQDASFVEQLKAGRTIKGIYMTGDVLMTEGQRTIRADEVFYDFKREKALAVNSVMRNFDPGRGIPIYLRAAKLRQLSATKFTADNVTLTSSEFYLPQISANASSVVITDTTSVDAQLGKVTKSSYEAEMRDVTLKMGNRTVFYWPFIRSNLERPDIPLKSVHTGYDSTYGASIETRWYLARLLGLSEPEGTESTLALDYFGKRGAGAGFEIEYQDEDYFGRTLAYLVQDSGEDDLGRAQSRRNIEPPRRERGRFLWRHRHFLPYNWQLTTQFGYASDEYFLEGFYRGEYNVGMQESYIHLKRIEKNRGLSFLGKARINDFRDQLEELPSVEFHLTGESVFGDRGTFYSDTQLSRLRQRIGDKHNINIDENSFGFASHRSELDFPLQAGDFQIVPYVAGNFGYDDRSGFRRSLVDGTFTGSFGKKTVWIGEAGLRASGQYWKVYPDVKSRLWDLYKLRHTIEPELAAAVYQESDDIVEQRDTFHLGLLQRLQTKRGPEDSRENVDWMRLNLDLTWVNNSEKPEQSGADRFIWNRPYIPMQTFSAVNISNSDLSSRMRRFERFGPRRSYFGIDYLWRVSDTALVISDLNYDILSGVVQQFDIGYSRLRWPDLSYYIGSRYLRRAQIGDEKGTNSFIFAMTYKLDPRYSMVFSQQYDFDYGANVRNDITLVRRYHRVCWAFTYSADESLREHAVTVSIWPQGVSELAIGSRRFRNLSGSAAY